jgi:hypothetical protein
MPLSVGARVGPYEVTGALGAGGMSACGPASERSETSRRSAGVGRLRAEGASASSAVALAEARPRATGKK